MTRTPLPPAVPNPYVDLGHGTAIHYAEVAAVHGCVYKSAPVAFPFPVWGTINNQPVEPRAIVVTRAGTLVPAYEPPSVVLRRVQLAHEAMARYARAEPADWTAERGAAYQRGYLAGRKRGQAEAGQS